VLPQNENLSQAWQEMLGPDWKRVQETYLHTIGNLTLTGYNSELSDRSFAEKRLMTGGFRDSPIRLNRDLARLETWDESAIQSRASRLADLAVQVWPAPHLSAATVDKYRPSAPARGTRTYTLTEDHPLLRDETMTLFQLLRTRILNLDPSVTEEIRSMYIAFKTSTNFVDVIPRKNRLKLTLNLDRSELDDPEHVCWTHDNKVHHGNGGAALSISSPDQLDYTMSLIHQAFAKHAEDGSG
jgi:predicted transport protein